ncbi:hypothetical protein PSTH2693_26455 [Pseudomonas syringae pv. theae]|nr:hypothetical protein PSTH2693_26455 [Pseudomonas syringae pv. theae]
MTNIALLREQQSQPCGLLIVWSTNRLANAANVHDQGTF